MIPRPRRATRAAALALALSAAPAEAAFEDLGAGARAPGMANAFTAVADDVYAIHYNPAGLALLERPEFGTAYTRHLLGLSDNSALSTAFLGYAHPLRGGEKGAAGASWEQFSLDSGLYQEQAFTLAYARKARRELGPGRLHGGLAAKYLRRSFGAFPEARNAYSGVVATGRADPVLSGRNAVGALDADLGVLYRLRSHYAAGLALQHVPQPNVAFSPSDSDRLPLTVKLGGSYRSLLSVLSLDYETRRGPANVRDHNLAVAVERWFPRLFVGDFGVRGGLNAGSREYRQLNFGLSYRTRRLGVDYAFAMPFGTIAGTAGSHRLGISFRFGSLREPDESVVMILEAMRQLRKGAAPELHALGVGLTPAQKALLGEHVALAGSLQAQAKYQAALERLGMALAVSPGDTELLKSFGRLNWVAQQVKELPEHKADPVQASWHQGILAYLAVQPQAAVDKAAYALSLQPGNLALDGFLAQLEVATGLKRPPPKPVEAPVYRVAQLLAQAAAAIEEGRYDDAVALSREVLAEDPANLAAEENLGTSYFAVGDYENSLSAWEKALALERNPARKPVLSGYIKSIRALLARRREPALRPVGTEVRLEVSPQEIQKIYNAGIDHYTAGQLEKARDAFQQVLRLDSAYVPAVKALKRVQEELAAR